MQLTALTSRNYDNAVGAKSFKGALQMCAEVFHNLKVY